MLDVMYEIPSLEGVVECVIDEPTILERSRPKLDPRKEGLLSGFRAYGLSVSATL